jgi:hypothetical protein
MQCTGVVVVHRTPYVVANKYTHKMASSTWLAAAFHVVQLAVVVMVISCVGLEGARDGWGMWKREARVRALFGAVGAQIRLHEP